MATMFDASSSEIERKIMLTEHVALQQVSAGVTTDNLKRTKTEICPSS